MTTASMNDWRSSRPPDCYPNSYDSYYGNITGGPPPPQYPGSYPEGSYYGSPRGGPPPPPPHHHHHHHHHHSSRPQQQSSPPVQLSRSESDFFFHETSPHSRPMSPTHGGTAGPPHTPNDGHGYERQHHQPHPSTPYSSRGGRHEASPYRSQSIHRGTPPFSARGGSSAAAAAVGASRSQRPYADPQHAAFYPDSPYTGRSRPLPPGPQRSSRFSMPLHRQHLPPVPRSAGSAPWEPPSPPDNDHETLKKQREIDSDSKDDESEFTRTLSPEDPEKGEYDERDSKGGDPLALLAKVSSDMETKPGQKSKNHESGTQVDGSVPPTSPLRRTTKTSPVITPTTDNTSSSKRKPEVQMHPSFAEAMPHPRSAGPPVTSFNAVTPMSPYYPHYGDEHRGPPLYHYGGPPPSSNGPAYPPPYPPPHYRRGPGPAQSWQRGSTAEPEYMPSSHSYPAVVEERHSFDSFESGVSHDSLRPPRRYYPPAPQTQSSSFGATDWNGSPPPPPGTPMSRPPPHPQQPYPPPPHYMYGRPPPPHHQPLPPPQCDPYHAAPYSYVQQPHMEEKTVLRRKFSWKHYPELEQFLLANRDDYLEHSSKNYTAEQKQYNNWLTEQLLALAERHNYTFDPEDFNFVAIRDRIRCYYKSYVQTARKRGLELPGKAHIKKHRPENGLDKYAEEKSKKLLLEQGDNDGGAGEGDESPLYHDNDDSKPAEAKPIDIKQTGEGTNGADTKTASENQLQ